MPDSSRERDPSQGGAAEEARPPQEEAARRDTDEASEGDVLVAKKKNSQPKHVKIAQWFWTKFEEILDPEHEELVDVHYRDRKTEAGPAGWNCILKVTRLGESYVHGVNFPVVGTPHHADIMSAFEAVRMIIDSATTKKSLLVTPEQAHMVKGPGGMPKVIPKIIRE